MATLRPDLRLGRIVWASVSDSRGQRKRRPAVIITATTDIDEEKPFAVLAISTSYPDPPPANHIELPWHPDRRRVSTRLNRRSAVVLDWYRMIRADDIDEYAGDVPPNIMIMILERMPP